MKPVNHLVISGIVASIFYIYFKSAVYSFVCFLSGIIIDVDHILDYYLHYRTFSAGLKHFYNTCIETEIDKLHLILHSYELIFILWILVFMFPKDLLLIAVSVGLTQHMLADQLGNKVDKLAYFFIFRLQKGFRKEHLFINGIKK